MYDLATAAVDHLERLMDLDARDRDELDAWHAELDAEIPFAPPSQDATIEQRSEPVNIMTCYENIMNAHNAEIYAAHRVTCHIQAERLAKVCEAIAYRAAYEVARFGDPHPDQLTRRRALSHARQAARLYRRAKELR